MSTGRMSTGFSTKPWPSTSGSSLLASWLGRSLTGRSTKPCPSTSSFSEDVVGSLFSSTAPPFEPADEHRLVRPLDTRGDHYLPSAEREIQSVVGSVDAAGASRPAPRVGTRVHRGLP